MEPMPAPDPVPAPQKTFWTILKTIPWFTVLGVLATVAFLVLCQFDNTAIRWWLMLPLAAAGGALLFLRRKHAPVWESRICTLTLCILLALVVLRDIGLARKLAELYDKMQSYKTQYHQATSEFRRFFEGSR